MQKLTKEEVLHVADLARLAINEDEIEKYGEQLKDILTEIDKINEVTVSGEMLIAPTTNQNCYREDQIGKMLSKEEIMKNVNQHMDGYVVVPRVIND